MTEEMITVSKLYADDAGLIANLAEEIWREYFTPIIGEAQVTYMLGKFQSASAIRDQIGEGVHYYFAVLAGEPVGYIAFGAEGEAVFLSKLYVKSSARGRGVAKQLFSFVSAFARFGGKDKIYLTVNKNNRLAIDVYRAMGFKKIDEVVTDIGCGFVMDDYRMELSAGE